MYGDPNCPEFVRLVRSRIREALGPEALGHETLGHETPEREPPCPVCLGLGELDRGALDRDADGATGTVSLIVSFESVRRSAPAMEEYYRVMLDDALGQADIEMTARELQGKLRRIDRFDEIAEDEAFRDPAGRAFFLRWVERVKDLWNYTPRREYSGRRPVEEFERRLRKGASRKALLDCPVIVPADFESPWIWVKPS